jgi:hypothetical protein
MDELRAYAFRPVEVTFGYDQNSTGAKAEVSCVLQVLTGAIVRDTRSAALCKEGPSRFALASMMGYNESGFRPSAVLSDTAPVS